MERQPVKANILRDMLALQLTLVKTYQRIEGLPPHPVDLGSKKGQSVLKDFAYRFTEELSEANRSLENCLEAWQENQPGNCKVCLAEYNIEIADAWHFLLEFLIFAGYGESEKVEELIKAYIAENEQLQGLYSEDRPFKVLLNMGAFINQKNGNRGILRQRNKLGNTRVVDEMEAAENPHFMGGRIISQDLMKEHAEYLWYVVDLLHRACNVLNNKVWAQEQKVLNNQQFERNLTMFLIMWATYMDFAGFSEVSIFNCYLDKNKINKKRIDDGY